MYQHVCQGAECPHCSPFALPPQVLPRWRPQRLHDLVEDRRVRLARLRDGRGEPVPSWPKGPYPWPSTTVIVVHGAHWQEGTPWQVICQQRKDNAWWGFPGGGQEIGEGLAECARRETLEETGYLVQVYGAVCHDSDPEEYACCTYSDGVMQYANMTFLATVQSGVMRSSFESLQVGWFSTDALPTPFLKSHLWRLDKAMAHRGPFLPVH